ncbi:histone-lysine N-methyltransferase EZA1-like [Cicer arietinum]|uniref:Histone-lysine N-methyltransferase EZA1-like n=1 Tax=Cicer arietinum TaxID=3827 RepID=A0A1S2Z4R7_CICAR|nr:histone-lysine N-methyltransferase EZA1-like [Cicer arietinum]
MVPRCAKPNQSMQEQHVEAATNDRQTLVNKINLLKEKIQEERIRSIKDKLKRNGKNLKCALSSIMTIVLRNDSFQIEETTFQMLSSRVDHPLYKLSGFPKGLRKNDHINNEDLSFEKSIKLPYIERVPPYTFWLHLVRNERMTKDQSFAARRNIYYEQRGGEALVCSDTDEELKENREVKHDFSHGEDQIIWMAFEEHNLTKEVLSIVQSYIGGTNSEIEERYKYLKEKDQHSKESIEDGYINIDICLEKSLSAALNTFDHLLCRRCLIFDCPLHGCSQPLVYPSEKQQIWNEPEGDRKPCSDHCYLQLMDANLCSKNSTQENIDEILTLSNTEECGNQSKAILEKETCNYGTKPSTAEVNCLLDLNLDVDVSESEGKEKEVPYEIETKQLSNSMEKLFNDMHSNSNWKPLEKDLYLKGIEMFGRNSCLIFRNLLSGFKTCMEIASYMYAEGSMPYGSMDENGKFDTKGTDHEMPSNSRSFRRKGKSKKLKYCTKSPGLPSMWRRISEGKDEPYKHYTPCGCEGMCGKQCPCLLKGSCCEKYCGCGKQCRNRFRGCHCVKSQCRSRQCPCFAAARECDPDVCRSCWISCGDGSLGEPPHRGDGLCENMKLLLRKKQRILLAKSNVAGWGAFLKNPANKNDFLGEYTGEVISYTEAEKRSKLYERADFSFLFDLDDQCVLDAYRKGDKLKFANHSSKPNCYARIMHVGGDYRVGIFAKERIEAGEELFYDYHFKDNHRPPAWFLKLSSNNNNNNNNNTSKRKESTDSLGKPKKRDSR